MIINEIFFIIKSGTFTFTQAVGHGHCLEHCLSFSVSLVLRTRTHLPCPPLTPTPTLSSPSPIETGYQSYLLNLMHALSTHSHPVTSPLNIETGFSGITRTFLRQNTPPPPTHPSPTPTLPLRPPVFWPAQTGAHPSSVHLWSPATKHSNSSNKWRARLMAFNVWFNG